MIKLAIFSLLIVCSFLHSVFRVDGLPVHGYHSQSQPFHFFQQPLLSRASGPTIHRTQLIGSSTGTYFDDSAKSGNSEQVEWLGICVGKSLELFAYYTDIRYDPPIQQGTVPQDTSICNVIYFDTHKGERLSKMDICASKTITYIAFTTNLGNQLSGGTRGGNCQTVEFGSSQTVIGFYGFVGTVVEALGIVYAGPEIPSTGPSWSS